MKREYIKDFKTKDLIPYDKNPRINDGAVDAIIKSIKRNGNIDPVEIDNENIILTGHSRLKAFNKMNIETTDIIRVTGLTEKQKKSYRVEHNKTNEVAEWDYNLLHEEFSEEELEDMDFSLDDFDSEDEEKEIIEDEIPELKKESIVKMRYIWLLGEHRLSCMDSTVVTDVGKLMDGEEADMILTDPPYGMNLDTDFSTMSTSKGSFKDFRGKSKNYDKVIGDNDDFTPELITTIFENFGYCKEIFIFGADYFSDLLQNKNKGSWIVWDKRAQIETMEWSTSEFELCWSKAKHHRKIARFMWCGTCGLQNEKEETKNNKGAIKREHPNQKPTVLFDWFFDNWGKDKKNIVDLYGGSGSILISCERNKKKCFCAEYSESYCQVIIDRYINFKQNSGDDVYLLKDGEKIPYKEVING